MTNIPSTLTRYGLELGGALLAYAAVLVPSLFWLDAHPEAGEAGRMAVALLPMLPCALICWTVLRHLRRLDELGLRIQLEAMAFAFAGTAMLTFSYGFLEGAGFQRLSLFVVWPLMCGLWTLGMLVASWRYR